MTDKHHCHLSDDLVADEVSVKMPHLWILSQEFGNSIRSAQQMWSFRTWRQSRQTPRQQGFEVAQNYHTVETLRGDELPVTSVQLGGPAPRDNANWVARDSHASEKIKDRLENGYCDIRPQPGGETTDLLLEFDTADPRPIHHISCQQIRTLLVTGAQICRLEGSADTLNLRKCRLQTLRLHHWGNGPLPAHRVTLEECVIEKLQVAAEFGGHVVLRDCTIGEFLFPEDSHLGSMDIFDTKFAVRNIQLAELPYANPPIVRRQSFNNLRQWGERMGDGKTAHIARGYEMRAEIAAEAGMSKWFLKIYWRAAGCGANPGRALLLMFAATIFVGVVYYLTDGIVLGLDNDLLKGWKELLDGDDKGARVLRAFVGAVQGVGNPFGIFSSRKLVEASNLYLAALMALHSTLSVIMLAFVVMSIRRRFKIAS